MKVQVTIEVPKLGFVKRRPNGNVDFISPLPCPFNYGSIWGTKSPDGDPLDAVVFGERLRPGTRIDTEVRAGVRFVDNGDEDPKLICSSEQLTLQERLLVEAFFSTYALLKRGLYKATRRPHKGRTAFEGWCSPEELRALDP